MPAIVLLKHGQDIYLSCDKTGGIHSYETVAEGVMAHEAENNQRHKRGYEASMSLCLANIQLQVGIIETKDLEEVMAWVGPEPKLMNLHSVAVRAVGVKVLPEHSTIFDRATQPRLISEDAHG